MKKVPRVFSVILLLLLFYTILFAKEIPSINLTILHINDFHGRILPYIVRSISEKVPVGGAAYLAQLINEERAKNPEGTILLAAGDMFQGTPQSNVFKGEPVVEIMNLLGFDAMAVGNHEFDWGQETLQRLVSISKFPYLSANILDEDGKYLPYLKPYVILERKGIKIAIIGLITPETAYITKPDYVQNLIFKNPEEVLPRIINEVKGKGANLVILLSHLGFNEDKKLAEKISGIDVIVGGHSHTVVTNPVLERGVIITQAGFNGIYLGVLELKIQPDTNIILGYTRENTLKTVFAGPENKFDERIARIVDKYNNQLKEEFAKVVGETLVNLVRNYNEESNVGNVICDAMRKAASADISFQNSGGIRTDINKGPITMELVYTLLPFDNVLVVMELTGEQVLKLLEQSAKLEKGILQQSGLKVKYDMTKSVGQRVVEVFVGDKPLELDKIYKVVTNDFLAAGGDNFITFKEGKNLVYGDMLRDVFVEYLKKHSPISPGVEGRSIIIK